MRGQVKIALWMLPLVLIFIGFVSQKQSELNEIEHAVSLKHPGEEYALNTILIEVRNHEGLPIEYYMDVESVICLAKVCKVIPVRLYWNNIGEYQKYTLKEGTTLEKYEADLFAPEDYTKIHSIMANSNSPFKDVFLEDIWTVPTIQEEDIDALSGATILALDEKDTVPGAALTCYTLWHWANGEVIAVIKDKTGESVSKAQLKEFIINGNKTYFNIALKELEQRETFEAPFINEVAQRILKESSLGKEAFAYFESSPSESYFDAVSQVFFKGEKEQRLMAIRSLKMIDIEIPKSYLDGFSEEFSQLESFQEVSALLDLIQDRNINSSIVNSNAVSLLDSDFLIARRAYWFLSNQELDSNQEKALQDFKKKNKERL